eukprot:6741623-Alexandrium_andersonii.AAC.1
MLLTVVAGIARTCPSKPVGIKLPGCAQRIADQQQGPASFSDSAPPPFIDDVVKMLEDGLEVGKRRMSKACLEQSLSCEGSAQKACDMAQRGDELVPARHGLPQVMEAVVHHVQHARDEDTGCE